MSITKEQRDEILRLVNAFDSTNSEIDYEAFRRYLDSLVAEPAEQQTMRTQTTTFVDDDARLHADDARAAMAAWVPVLASRGISDDDVNRGAQQYGTSLADAMAAERKRRQG